MKQPTKRFLSVVVATAFIFGALVIYQNFTKVIYEDAQKLKGTLIENQNIIQRQEEDIKAFDDLEKIVQQKKLQKEILASVLPFDEDEADALHQVYGIASANNLAVQSVKFSLIKNSAPAPAEIVDATDVIRPPGVIEMVITVNGTYQNFKKMLRDLETNIRIFTIREIGLSDGVIPEGETEIVATAQDSKKQKTDIELILDQLKKAAAASGVGSGIAPAGDVGSSIRYQYTLRVATYYQK